MSSLTPGEKQYFEELDSWIKACRRHQIPDDEILIIWKRDGLTSEVRTEVDNSRIKDFDKLVEWLKDKKIPSFENQEMVAHDAWEDFDGAGMGYQEVITSLEAIVAANEFKTVSHTSCTWVQYVKEDQFSVKEGEDKDPVCTSEFQGQACGKEPGQECYCKMKV